MKAKKYWALVVLVATSCTIACLTAVGGNEQVEGEMLSDRQTLTGLNGIYVWPPIIPAELEQYGLRKDRIRTQIELRLREFGIRVLEEKDLTLHTGFLGIAIQVHPEKNYLKKMLDVAVSGLPACALRYDVQLLQNVSLLRKQMIIFPAPTWHMQGVSLLTKDNLTERTMSRINDCIDTFINDYLAANPKEAATTYETTTTKLPVFEYAKDATERFDLQEYVSEKHSFRVRFPTKPTVTDLGFVTNYGAIVVEEGAYNVFVNYLQEEILHDREIAALQDILEGRTATYAGKAILIGSREVMFLGHKGLDYEYSGEMEGIKIYHKGIYFVRGKKQVYGITVVCPEETRTLVYSKYNDFVKSFNFIEGQKQ